MLCCANSPFDKINEHILKLARIYKDKKMLKASKTSCKYIKVIKFLAMTKIH